MIAVPVTGDVARDARGSGDLCFQPPFDRGDCFERTRPFQARAAPASVRTPRSMI